MDRQQQDAARRARDALIWELYQRGRSMAEIAGKAGCSVGTVHRIITARRVEQ